MIIMIGKIKGILSEIAQNKALIETSGGVYYELFIPHTFIQKHLVGTSCELYTYLHVKDDGLTLYGFENRDQHRMFTLLLSVHGVGPKSAFTIVQQCSPDEIIRAVKEGNSAFFTAISGIGKKTAHTILLELSGKIGATFDIASTQLSKDDETVLGALSSLGFDKKSGREIVHKLDRLFSIEEKIKQAIQLLTKS